MTVDVILPCLNEASALPWVLGRMPAGFRAIVVDNGSTDGSGALARSLGVTVVPELRRGFGAAAHAGLLAATADLVSFCDCDGSLDPRQLPQLAAPLLAGEADLVLGHRAPTRREIVRCQGIGQPRERHLEERPVEAVYDDVLLPSLHLAAQEGLDPGPVPALTEIKSRLTTGPGGQ